VNTDQSSKTENRSIRRLLHTERKTKVERADAQGSAGRIRTRNGDRWTDARVALQIVETRTPQTIFVSNVIIQDIMSRKCVEMISYKAVIEYKRDTGPLTIKRVISLVAADDFSRWCRAEPLCLHILLTDA
jgi:hypothetical protein